MCWSEEALAKIILAGFPPSRRLCFVKYLKHYEKVTKKLRQKAENTPNLLFISYVKPHKPVTSARWVKTVLSLAGIDGVFTAHSTRGASTSAAARAGVALSDIMEASDLSRESTFKNFITDPLRRVNLLWAF